VQLTIGRLSITNTTERELVNNKPEELLLVFVINDSNKGIE
jgi:hypothetical protein